MTLNKINKNILIQKSCTIAEAMKALVECGTKCLIVINSKSIFLGTLNDSDIRQAILKGKKTDCKIDKLYNKKPKYFQVQNYSKNEAKKLFLKYSLDIIPIIDKSKKLTDIVTLRDIFDNKDTLNKKKLMLPVLIMAGGKGERMKPFTTILPKPLLPINNKPLIEHIVEKFTLYGVKKFYASVNFKSKIIEAVLEETMSSYKIKIVREKMPLGTAGSLSNFKIKNNTNFFLTNCDIIINHDYKSIYEHHLKSKNIITIVVAIKKYSIPYGNCKLDKKGNFTGIQEKPEIELLANTGFYIINSACLKLIDKNKKLDMNEFIEICKKKNLKIGLYPIKSDDWIDVGQWNEYKDALNHSFFS